MVGGNSFFKEADAWRDLKVLEEIEKDSNLSQRALAKRLGVALGIANSCIHALVRKGLIKIRGDNNRSITYHLTKRGLLHKSKLAMEWTKNTIDFYRQARRQVALQLENLAKEGVRTIVLYGANELSEITAIVAPENNIEIKGIIKNDNSYMGNSFLGIPVGGMKILESTKPDALIVCTELNENERKFFKRELRNCKYRGKIYSLIGKVF